MAKKKIKRRTPIWHTINWLTRDENLAGRVDALGGSFLWRQLCAFCGVDFDDPGKATIDYLKYRISQLQDRKSDAEEVLSEIDGQRKRADGQYRNYASEYPKKLASVKHAKPGSPEAAALAQGIELVVNQAAVCQKRVEQLTMMVDAKVQEIKACNLKIQLAQAKIQIAKENIEFADSMAAYEEFVDLGEDIFDEIDDVFAAAQLKADEATSLDEIRTRTNTNPLAGGDSQYVLDEYRELPTLEQALENRRLPMSFPEAQKEESKPYEF